MTDLDAALDHQGALAVRAGVAFDDIAQVGDLGQRQVALPVHAEVVLVLDVGASGEIAHQGDGAVDDAGDRQVGLRSEYQRAGDQRLVGGLDFVELMIAADDQGDQGAFFGAMHHQGLDGFLDR